MKTWWRRRSLRARLTFIATAALGVGIAAASLLLLRGFATSRLNAIDGTSRTVAANLAHLTQAGALPQVLPMEPGQSGQVTDAGGGVLAASPGTLRTLTLIPSEKLGQLARTGPSNQGVTSINGQSLARVRVQAVALDGSTAYVVVASSLADERATLAGLSHAVLVGAPLLLLAVASTIWLLLGRALRTVDALRLGAQAITDPLTSDQLPVPSSHDEIHHLATTLNDMIGRLAATSERERAFIADAAHELRSPVAAIRTQLEMTVAAADPATAREFAQGALRDTARLSALIQDLLALARLESSTRVPDQPVDVAALAGVASDQPCIVSGDATSLGRAIDNLRSNAARHGTHVHTIVERTGIHTVEIHVDDDGPGVPLEHRERIFERLVRLDPARTRDDGGTGLGLAIVAATARAHGGRVQVTESPIGGARFTLTLPAHPSPGPTPAAEVFTPATDCAPAAPSPGRLSDTTSGK
jgi:signal transduction histidine kinase